MKRERKERKERENTLPLLTLLRAFNHMDVAGRARSLTLAIGATHVNILSASINKMQKFIFSIQACLKVTFHVRTHARGAIVVLLMKIIMDSSAQGRELKSFAGILLLFIKFFDFFLLVLASPSGPYSEIENIKQRTLERLEC